MSKNNNFIERSVTDALTFLKESIFADEYASRKGFLQSLDPRVKTITFLMFIMAILFTKSIAILIGLYAACLALAYLSNVGMGFFLKRTWIFIPLFSLFIAIPALFNVFTPGEAFLTINVVGFKLIITHQGLAGAALFVMRVVTSVSFVILLSITTKHFALLKVLRILGIPQVFVMTLGMCYRYIYLFVGIVENTYLAIKSRVGIRVPRHKGQRIVAWNIASLWMRSYQLNEEVYKAMLSRGFNGEPAVLNEFKVRPIDAAWLFVVVTTLGFLVMLTYLLK